MQHFLSLADVSSEEIWRLLHLAQRLKQELRAGGNRPVLAGKALAMLFEKQSLRTRVSFEMGMVQTGGYALYLSPAEVGLGQRETVADAARVLGRFVHAIMWRGFAQQTVEELAAYAGVPVINGLSNEQHPCQALTDVFTVWEKLGRLEGVRLAYVGDGNNVAVSLAHACTKLGMHFVCAAPAGYQLPQAVVTACRAFASASGGSIELTADPYAAARDADALYTDVWTSMGQEAEAEARRRIFPPYQLNARLVAAARPGALVMHDMPARRGQEITDEVMDGPQSVVFDQAENRLHAQKALLVELLSHG